MAVLEVAPARPVEQGAASPHPARGLARFHLPEIGYLATASILMGAGYRLWNDCRPTDNLEIMALDLLCYALAFGLLLNLRRQFLGSTAVLIGALVALFATSYGVIKYVQPTYQADVILFNHYSATLFLHGINPYSQSMVPAYHLFNVPQDIVTPTTTGNAIYSLSYPALSFLVYVPFMLESLRNMLWVSVLFHGLVIAALFFIAPPRMRYIAPLALNVDPSYLNYTLGGVTDVIWVLPMIFCAYYWKSKPLLSATALGLAISLKQNPWLVLPFALVHWAFWAQQTRNVGNFLRPTAIALGIFALINGPFIVASPQAWLHGTLAPLAASPIPYGSGIVQILANTNIPASALGPLWLGVLAVFLALYALSRRRFDLLPFIAPAVALFFASRSLQNYFMYWPPIVLGFVLGAEYLAEPAHVRAAGGWIARRGMAFALGGVALIVVVLGSVYQARATSLNVTLLDPSFDTNTRAIDGLRVAVQNVTKHPQAVRFAVFSDNVLRFWNHGFPMTVAPQSTTTATIRADGAEDQLRPIPGHSIQVIAVDVATGRETYSDKRRFFLKLSPSQVFANGGLQDWSGKPLAPRSWSFDSQQLRAGVIEKATVDGHQGLRFNILSSPQSGWHLASIDQIVPASFGKVFVRMYPTHDFEGGAYPTGFFGVEMIDAENRHRIITIDSKATTRHVISRADGTTYEIVPGTLYRWNDVPIDLEAIAKNGGFLIGSDSYLSFNVTDAVYGAGRTAQHDVFGGVFGGS